jgi:membrane protein DedA with SNARE-associated domain
METGIWFAVIAFFIYFIGFIVSRKNKDWAELPCLCLAVIYLVSIIAHIVKLARSIP